MGSGISSCVLSGYTNGECIGAVNAGGSEAHKKSQLDSQSQRRQIDFISKLNQSHLEQNPNEDVLDSRLKSLELAYRMQTSMPDIQSISGETSATQRQYGIDDPVTADFGRQCLMARVCWSEVFGSFK